MAPALPYGTSHAWKMLRWLQDPPVPHQQGSGGPRSQVGCNHESSAGVPVLSTQLWGPQHSSIPIPCSPGAASRVSGGAGGMFLGAPCLRRARRAGAGGQHSTAAACLTSLLLLLPVQIRIQGGRTALFVLSRHRQCCGDIGAVPDPGHGAGIKHPSCWCCAPRPVPAGSAELAPVPPPPGAAPPASPGSGAGGCAGRTGICFPQKQDAAGEMAGLVPLPGKRSRG